MSFHFVFAVNYVRNKNALYGILNECITLPALKYDLSSCWNSDINVRIYIYTLAYMLCTVEFIALNFA